MSTVDVVIPCYNYARFLKASVGSVLAQPGVDVRVLVIDDCSSDDTPVVCAALAAADSRVEFRRHEINCGHIATYNEGLIGWSTGDYVVLLSADDMLAPGALQRATAIMDADPKIGMVYGRPFYFSDETDLAKVPRKPRGVTTWKGHDWLEGRCRAGHNVISSPEVVVRGNIQRRVGGYDPQLPHLADLEMWLRISAVSDVGYIRGVPQAFYRRHSESMTKHRTKLVDLFERAEAYQAFYTRHVDTLSDAARLKDLACRALAREALWDACRAYDRDQVVEAGVDKLRSFARCIYNDVETQPEYAALRRRERLGAAICNRTQLFAAPAAIRRVRKWFWWRRWEREGV